MNNSSKNILRVTLSVSQILEKLCGIRENIIYIFIFLLEYVGSSVKSKFCIRDYISCINHSLLAFYKKHQINSIFLQIPKKQILTQYIANTKFWLKLKLQSQFLKLLMV